MATKRELTATEVITGKVRLSYVHLIEPKAFEEGDPEKYSCVILVPKSDTATVKAINQAIEAAKKEGESKLKGKRNIKTPLRDGDDDSDQEAYEGHWFFSASSNAQPTMLDAKGGELFDKRDIYSGCYAQCIVKFYAFDKKSYGIAAAINAVKFVADGEPFGNAMSVDTAAAMFGNSEYEGDEQETEEVDDLDGLI